MFLISFIFLFALNCGVSGWAYYKSIRAKYDKVLETDESKKAKNYEQGLQTAYKEFRNNYILVYLCMMMADWLQGPYVYKLYRHYGYEIESIGYLFIMGFLSSAIFGTVISSFADKYGRKRMAMAFCVIYSLSCFTKLWKNFHVLLLGRFLGGISTSLLFSVFEAWMVNQHNANGFPEEWLSETFVWATYGNGLIAIASGILANISVEITGSYVAPFMVSAAFLGFGGYIVMTTWTENYGEIVSSSAEFNILETSLFTGFVTVFKDIRILCVGAMASLFEGSMYIFVFMWSPVLEKDGDEHLPFGLIFATFMVCIMLGSVCFRYASTITTHERMMTPLLLVASLSLYLAVPEASSTALVYLGFNLFEICCGVYFPNMGTIRGKYIPEKNRASVMTIFRIPLNLIVVLVLTNVATWKNSFIFTLSSTVLLIAVLFSVVLVKKTHA